MIGKVNNLLGVVLCGGQSSRMGHDKGLLQKNDINWASAAKEKIASLSLKTILSINPIQREAYASHFKIDDLVVDLADLEIGGPLKGVVSIHSRFPSHDLLILACDLPNMQQVVLEELITSYNEHNEAEAFVFRNHERAEPLCGIYSSNGLRKIFSAHQSKQLRRHSMHHALDILSTHFISMNQVWEPAFRNFNAPEDLKEL